MDRTLTKQKRNTAMEIPRIIAMIFIVFSHFAVHGVGSLDKVVSPGSFNYYLLSNATLNVGTDIFVLIFGYFCIKSVFSRKKVLKLWLGVWTYSLLLYPVALMAGRQFQWNELDTVLLPVIFNEYWFFTAYMVLFLFTPYINRFLLSLSQKEMKRLIGLMVLLWSFLPMIPGTKLYGTELLQLFMLYCIGAWLRLYPKSSLCNRKNVLVGMLSLAVLLMLGLYFYIHVLHIDTYYLRARHSLLIVGFSTCLVSFFANLRPIHIPWVNWLAGSMFGVYLIHDNPFVRPLVWKWLHAREHANDPALFLYMLLCTAVIIGVCVLIDKVKAALIDRPLNRLADRWEEPHEKGVWPGSKKRGRVPAAGAAGGK